MNTCDVVPSRGSTLLSGGLCLLCLALLLLICTGPSYCFKPLSNAPWPITAFEASLPAMAMADSAFYVSLPKRSLFTTCACHLVSTTYIFKLKRELLKTQSQRRAQCLAQSRPR